MGTRSITAFYNGEKFIGSFYMQYDGNPTGVGSDIIGVLNNGDVRMVNGYSGADKHPEAFNGIGDLAAYVIQKMKQGIGGLYLDGSDPRIDGGQEWNYLFTSSIDNPILTLQVRVCDKVLFNGPVTPAIDMEAIQEEGYR